jgi:hypothetical protein
MQVIASILEPLQQLRHANNVPVVFNLPGVRRSQRSATAAACVEGSSCIKGATVVPWVLLHTGLTPHHVLHQCLAVKLAPISKELVKQLALVDQVVLKLHPGCAKAQAVLVSCCCLAAQVVRLFV